MDRVPIKHVAQATHGSNSLCSVCEAAIIWCRSDEGEDTWLEFQPSHEAFQESTLKCSLCAFIFSDILLGENFYVPQGDDVRLTYELYIKRRKDISKLTVLRNDTTSGIPYPLPSGGTKGTYFVAHPSGKHHRICISN